MSIGKSLSKAVKKATKVISSPTRTVAAGFTGGLSELGGLGNKISDSSWSRYTDALGYAALAAVGAGALGGAAGVGEGAGVSGWAAGATGADSVLTGASMAGGATGATTGSTIGAGLSALGTAGAIGGSAYLGYKQMSDAQKMASDQNRAMLQAQMASEQANREAEILRKQALLASQKSITARKAAASAVANKLKNTNVSYLGGDEEKLGG